MLLVIYFYMGLHLLNPAEDPPSADQAIHSPLAPEGPDLAADQGFPLPSRVRYLLELAQAPLYLRGITDQRASFTGRSSNVLSEAELSIFLDRLGSSDLGKNPAQFQVLPNFRPSDLVRYVLDHGLVEARPDLSVFRAVVFYPAKKKGKWICGVHALGRRGSTLRTAGISLDRCEIVAVSPVNFSLVKTVKEALPQAEQEVENLVRLPGVEYQNGLCFEAEQLAGWTHALLEAGFRLLPPVSSVGGDSFRDLPVWSATTQALHAHIERRASLRPDFESGSYSIVSMSLASRRPPRIQLHRFQADLIVEGGNVVPFPALLQPSSEKSSSRTFAHWLAP